MGSLSITHWLIVLVVVVLIFGTKKLKNAGKDLGEAVRGFKEGMKGETDKDATPASSTAEKGRLIEGEHSEDPTKKS